jgi:hypothetical protein
MRKVIVVERMSLDGVVQSAGAADDTTLSLSRSRGRTRPCSRATAPRRWPG